MCNTSSSTGERIRLECLNSKSFLSTCNTFICRSGADKVAGVFGIHFPFIHFPPLLKEFTSSVNSVVPLKLTCSHFLKESSGAAFLATVRSQMSRFALKEQHKNTIVSLLTPHEDNVGLEKHNYRLHSLHSPYIGLFPPFLQFLS